MEAAIPSFTAFSARLNASSMSSVTALTHPYSLLGTILDSFTSASIDSTFTYLGRLWLCSAHPSKARAHEVTLGVLVVEVCRRPSCLRLIWC